MYRVFLERAAEKDLKSLSSKLHNQVIAALQRLAKNPRPAGCRKLTRADNDWRIRVGDYRIVYEIDDTAQNCSSKPHSTPPRSLSVKARIA